MIASVKKSFCYLIICHENNRYFLFFCWSQSKHSLNNALNAQYFKVTKDFIISFSFQNYITVSCHIHIYADEKFATSCNYWISTLWHNLIASAIRCHYSVYVEVDFKNSPKET